MTFGAKSAYGNPVRMTTATAIVPLNAMSIDKREMIRLLHDEPEFAGKFVNYMLERNIKIEADLGGFSGILWRCSLSAPRRSSPDSRLSHIVVHFANFAFEMAMEVDQDSRSQSSIFSLSRGGNH